VPQINAASKFPAKNLAQSMMSNCNTVKFDVGCHCIVELWSEVVMFSKKTRAISLKILRFQILSWVWLIWQTFFWITWSVWLGAWYYNHAGWEEVESISG
jgi:hypothetical protein